MSIAQFHFEPKLCLLLPIPGKLQFSSVGLSAADMAARILGEHNNLIRSEVAQEVDRRRASMRDYLADTLAGENVRLVIPKGAATNAEQIRAVVLAGGMNVNQALIDGGYGQYREDLGGAEAQALYGSASKAFGRFAEALAFQGDSSFLNPNRYLPNSFQTRCLRPAGRKNLRAPAGEGHEYWLIPMPPAHSPAVFPVLMPGCWMLSCLGAIVPRQTHFENGGTPGSPTESWRVM